MGSKMRVMVANVFMMAASLAVVSVSSLMTFSFLLWSNRFIYRALLARKEAGWLTDFR